MNESQILHGFPTGKRGGLWTPLNPPVRILDTRAGATGVCLAPGATLAAASDNKIKVTTPCRATPVMTVQQPFTGIPPEAVGVTFTIFAVTIVGGLNGYYTVYPAGNARPTNAVVNYNYALWSANNLLVPGTQSVGLSPSGELVVFTFREVGCVLDVTGYYLPVGE